MESAQPILNPPEFAGFPKMGRLFREIVITEKIDGSNAQVLITPIQKEQSDDFLLGYWYGPDASTWGIYAGSRTRWVKPGADNYGFAGWVREHIEQLKKLGPGRHFGEWWGRGINRNYGAPDRRFSLFNTVRWAPAYAPEEMLQPIPNGNPTAPVRYQEPCPDCCSVVPELFRGPFSLNAIHGALDDLRHGGSRAYQGFQNPEGIVTFHLAANVGFKTTLENDGKPKGTL